MFEEIEEIIKEDKFKAAEKKLDKLLDDNEISEKDKSRVYYILGYINSSWRNEARNEAKAKKYLLWNIKSEYPNPYSYVLYARIEKDRTIAVNYLKNGLEKFKGNSQIIIELIKMVDDNEKEILIKQINDENIVDYNLLIKVLEFFIVKNDWNIIRKYIEIITKNFTLSDYEKILFELLNVYSFLFGNETYNLDYLVEKLKYIIKNDLDNKLKYSPYLAIVYAYMDNSEYQSANLYFDRISLNNSIGDLYDEFDSIIDVDFSFIYKKIFNKFFEIYKKDSIRNNKAIALYILYLYNPSEIFGIYRYSKKDITKLEKYFNNSKFNLEIAIALYKMKLYFNMRVEAYEILIKILLERCKVDNNFFEIFELFEDLSDEELIAINFKLIELLEANDEILKYNNELRKFINLLISYLYDSKLYDEITKLCNIINVKLLMELDESFKIAYSFAEDDKKDKALKIYENLLLKDPNDSAVLNNAAIIYENYGLLEKAFEYIKKAYELEKDDIHTNNYNRIYNKLENKNSLEKSNESKKLQEICKNLTLDNLDKIGYNIVFQERIDKISDEELRKILNRDLRECAYAVLLKQNKSVIVLSGSIIEALLIFKIKSAGITQYDLAGLRGRKSSSIKTIDKMILDELLYVANKSQLLSDTNYYLSHFSREYRNVIHPNKEIRAKMEISEENASLMWKILREIIFEIL